MKKFGTPIGAGPGSANENVGFDGVGTPPLPCGEVWLGLLDFPWPDEDDPDPVLPDAVGPPV
jgi:hypothetical protein